MSNITYQEWQKAIIDLIDNKNNTFDDSVDDYTINISNAIHIKLPIGSGHTLLAAKLYMERNGFLIYTNSSHFYEINKVFSKLGISKSEQVKESSSRSIASAYEMFYCIQNNNTERTANNSLAEIKFAMRQSDIIVIDQSSMVPEIVKEFIYQVANPNRTSILFLG